MDWKEFSLHIGYLSGSDQQRVKSAFSTGKKAHEGQLRASGEPYFIHPIAVAIMLTDMRADSDAIIAALLHDTVEDTSLTLEDINVQFDGKVSSIIDGVTKLKQKDLEKNPTLKDLGENISLNEKIETLRKIFIFMDEDVRIMVIKLNDRLHNMQTIQYLPLEKQKKYAKETLDVYVKIAERLSMEDLRDALEEICLSIVEPELLTELQKLRKKNKRHGEKILPNILKKFTEATSLKVDTIHFERKSWNKLKSQLESGGSPITGVSALTLTIVSNSIAECYQFLGIVHQLYRREHLSFQDFINSPMINGYRGLHTTIILEDGTRIRIKIRTQKMEAYAHKGIATRCFDSKAVGFYEYLPWTKRIAPLSKGTIDRSQQFWKSLQSDILGDSIVIHGIDDQAILLPVGSTALDGAFYIYDSRALQLKKIKIDGKDVSFTTLLESGVSLEVEISKKKTVHRDWLQWTHSGLAASIIRDGLTKQSEQMKLKIGKELLQGVMTIHKKGYIEEFNRNNIHKKLLSIGYDSIKDAYLALGEGRIEPQDIYNTIFSKQKKGDIAKQKSLRITYTFPIKEIEVTKKLAEIRRKYADNFKKIRFSYNQKTSRGTTLSMLSIAPEDEKKLIADFKIAGVQNLSVQSGFPAATYMLSIIVLMVLWGLDPVAARLLIHAHNLSTIDLTLVRFWSLTAMAGVFFAWKKYDEKLSHQPVPLFNASLLCSVILLICISLTTYLSLQTTSPSNYTIPMTIGGVLLTTIVNKRHWRTLIVTWLLIIAGSIILVAKTPNWPVSGMLYTLLSVISFSLFSVVSEQFKKKENIAARAVEYFFYLSLLCTIFTLPLLARTMLHQMPMAIIMQMTLFSIIFTGLPYYIYYHLLSYKQIDFVLRYSFLIIFASIVGESLILGTSHWPSIIPAATLVVIGATLPIARGWNSTQ